MSGPVTETAAARAAEQRAWYAYDFANSAFSSTVVTLFLGPWLTQLAKSAADASGRIYPLGIAVDARSYWSYLIATSVVTQVICLPFLGAIADSSARKKQLLALFAYLGAGATIAMYFLEGRRFLLGGGLFVAANFAFHAALVIYNAFLNEIATERERDSVSSKGWGIGYLGGGLLLALNLLLYQKAGALGLSEGLAVRISLCSAGVWWALFSIWPVTRLRNRWGERPATAGGNLLRASVRQLAATLRDLRKYPQTLTFLLAYLLYNDAVQAVIALSGQYAHDHLGIPMSQLTLAILMVQFVAFGGALLFNIAAKKLTAKGAVMLALVLWTGVMVGLYAVKTVAHFFLAAALVGIIMGGTQALSRSLYSLMIPRGQEAEYFSLYEVSDKGTSWLAPLIYGLTLQFTGSYGLAILSLIIFFVSGLLVLVRVDVQRAAREAGSGGFP